MNKRPTLSLCMIVKDEEESILTCLNSVKYLVDEMVVVDTGSADHTVRLAHGAGARVYEIPWPGDFARARNYALEQAVAEWVLVLDADEVLEPVDVEEFNGLLDAPDVEGYFLHLKNYLGTGRGIARDQAVRLFRNKPAYRFAGAIHEQVATSILKANGGRGLAVAPLTIHHYGYVSAQVAKKDKYNRNIGIINRELTEHPDNVFLLYCLAIEHYQRGEVTRGMECLEKALGLMRGNEGYFEDVLLNYAMGLLSLGKFVPLADFTHQSLQMLPKHPDLCFFRGLANYGLGKYQAAAADFARSQKLGGSKTIPDFKILSFLGDAHNLCGNYTLALDAYLKALRCSETFLYPLTQIIGLYQRGKMAGDFSRVVGFTSRQGKKRLYKRLLEAGENSLAMVVLLLAMHDLAAESAPNEDLIQFSQEFSRTIPRLAPASGRRESFAYACITSREVQAYALMITKGCHSETYNAGNRLKVLIEKMLLLLIMEFCPDWSPNLLAAQSLEG